MHTRQGERGFILISVYMLLATLIILTGALLSHAMAEVWMGQRSQASLQALYLAEGGLDSAIAQLRANPSWTGGSGTASTGTYTVVLQNLSGNQKRITSQGSAASASSAVRTVEAIVQVGPKPLFPFAIFAAEEVELKGNALTDSYDSSKGIYQAATAGTHGDIGTNSTEEKAIELTGNALVRGTALVGVGGNPATGIELTSNAQILVPPGALDTPEPMTPVTIPNGLTNQGILQISGNKTVTVPGGTYWYDQIKITGNGRLNFTGPTELYLSGKLEVGGNGIGTANNIPGNLLVYGQGISSGIPGGGDIRFTGNAAFYGAVYAPTAKVEIKGNGSVFGALVGEEVENVGNAAVHYDEALKSIGGGSGSQVQILSWQDIA